MNDYRVTYSNGCELSRATFQDALDTARNILAILPSWNPDVINVDRVDLDDPSGLTDWEEEQVWEHLR